MYLKGRHKDHKCYEAVFATNQYLSVIDPLHSINFLNVAAYLQMNCQLR